MKYASRYRGAVSKSIIQLGVVRAFNPSTQEAKALDLCGFQASLVYIYFWARQSYKVRPCLKNKNKNKNKQNNKTPKDKKQTNKQPPNKSKNKSYLQGVGNALGHNTNMEVRGKIKERLFSQTTGILAKDGSHVVSLDSNHLYPLSDSLLALKKSFL